MGLGRNKEEQRCENKGPEARRSLFSVDTKLPLWGMIVFIGSGFGVAITGIWRLAHIDGEFEAVKHKQQESSMLLREVLNYTKQFAIDNAIQDGMMKDHENRLRRIEEEARDARNTHRAR